MPGKKNKTKMIPVSPESLGFRTQPPAASSSSNRNTAGSRMIPESHFRLRHPAVSPASSIVDTHTHLALTFESYRRKYPAGKYKTVHDFVKGLYVPAGVEQIVDVWCEAPVRPLWREFADSAVTEEQRRDFIKAMAHPRCVGWGEMGLDYHYDTSPRPVQRTVFERQLRCAVRLNKPLTIHSREADDDTERILKDLVPKDHRIHIHCFTNAPAFAQRLLDHFPNLYIGITGVITYSSNRDTSTTVRSMFGPAASTPPRLRIVLETDAPYMVPSTIYNSPSFAAPELKGVKLPMSHCGMLPWTAVFVADLLPRGKAGETEGEEGWDAKRVMSVARENARAMYGV
ncbi:hypothetical protein B0H19DRAFT_1236445 [Mycena capillaripes]|nr:hypothetical protein B0H19DRAFT_1236445 [Mycena capillaripes]